MSSHSSPNVYVKEIDVSQRIAGVSTSIGAIVGRSNKGPVMERTLITSTKQFIETFGEPDPKVSFMHYCALQFLEQSSRLYVTRADSPSALTAGALWSVDDINATTHITRLTNFDNGTNQPLGKYDPLNTYQFDPQLPGIENILGFFCAINPGSWNNRISIKIKPSVRLGLSTPDDIEEFWVEVYVDYVSATQFPTERFYVSRDYRLDGFGNQINIEEVINTKSNYIRYKPNPYVTSNVIGVVSEVHEFLDGAVDGDPVSESAIINAWDLYQDPEHVDVNILINGGYSTPNVQRRMAEICQKRMDSIAVLDTPSNLQQVASAISYRSNTLNLDTSYAALYTPDAKIYDKFNDLELFVPPSGLVAAAYARTDEAAETWFAPAGMSRGDLKVLGVRYVYTLGDRDALTDTNINGIRFFPGKGYKIWGADTLQTMSSALTNVNVRRLLNFIEKSISTAALYSVMEPNDPILWARLEEMCSRFLKPIQAGRGLYYYRVICDESNNLPETIARGETILDVYLDPVIPAKRIHLNAVVIKTGSLFKERALDTTNKA